MIVPWQSIILTRKAGRLQSFCSNSFHFNRFSLLQLKLQKTSFSLSPFKTCGRYGLTHTISGHFPTSDEQCGKSGQPNHWQHMCCIRTPSRSPSTREENDHSRDRCWSRPWCRGDRNQYQSQKGRQIFILIIQINQNHINRSRIYTTSYLLSRSHT